MKASNGLAAGELCFALGVDGMMHKARVMDVVESSGKRRFRIHYDGWHKRYDESVTPDFLLPMSKAGSAAADAMNAEARATADAFRKAKSESAKSSSKMTSNQTKKN